MSLSLTYLPIWVLTLLFWDLHKKGLILRWKDIHFYSCTSIFSGLHYFTNRCQYTSFVWVFVSVFLPFSGFSTLFLKCTWHLPGSKIVWHGCCCPILLNSRILVLETLDWQPDPVPWLILFPWLLHLFFSSCTSVIVCSCILQRTLPTP